MRLFTGGAGGALLASRRAAAQANDAVAIGWPSDVPAWDPNQRFTPDAQPIFKLVFDQPLEQSPKLDLVPHLVVKWEIAPDGLSMPVEFARRRHLSQRRQADHAGLPLHLLRARRLPSTTRRGTWYSRSSPFSLPCSASTCWATACAARSTCG